MASFVEQAVSRRLSVVYLFVAFVLGSAGAASQAFARDLFSSFPTPSAPMAYAAPPAFGDWDAVDRPRTRIVVRPSIRRSIGDAGSQAFCVRTCDGRYFPINSASKDSAKELCRNSCPATETRIYSGRSIETSVSSGDGKPYAKILNAFRFRNESVAGCTCQASGKFGLAHIRIEDDKTIRVGDIVADANGLMVASEGRNGLVFSRVRASRLKAERLPAVAAR